jgi:UDP-N-acetyl-D-galactosamine dehydrogenase
LILAVFESKVTDKSIKKGSNVSDFLLNQARAKLAIIGLGYVGLPLALAFGEKFKTIAFDISTSRIQELISGIDKTGEITTKDLLKVKNCRFTDEITSLEECNTYVVTVPTPIDKNKRPDLSFLISASELVAKFLSVGDVVIFESTVYPGATEELCVPIIEEASGLKFNNGFFVGYSPERINPGDKTHRLTDIVKVTSGSNDVCAAYVDDLYKSIIKAGTYKAKSIKIAEAAKVIENTQRDVNIALINELSILFQKLGIDTKAVLDAAASKWNFLNFKPGLVGGHCIGVDPYYLTHKAQEVNHHPRTNFSWKKNER